MEVSRAHTSPETPISAGSEQLPGRKLRLLLDARKILDGGIGVYTNNLVEGLLANGTTELTLIGRRESISDFSWSKQVNLIEDETPSYSFNELFLLPRRIDFSAYDLFHIPHFTLPYGVPIPTVITIHDLIHVNHPERWYYPLVAKPLIKSAIRRATKVLTVSESSFADIKRLSPRNSSKVTVVPNALDPSLLSDTGDNSTSSRYGKSYLLAVVSMLKPHKGVRDLLGAFRKIQARANGDKTLRNLKLVLVGKGAEDIAELGSLLNEVGDIKAVHVLGRVSKEELKDLYRNALALVVPSTAEGFCLPVLEAKALGTTVIARPVPAVKELLSAEDFVCKSFAVEEFEKTILEAVRAAADGALKSDYQNVRSRYNREDIARAVSAVYHQAVKECRK